MVAPPSVPEERLIDWRLASDATETPFAAPGLTVSARVRRYEDDRLRAAVRDATGVDRVWRFFLAARVELSPSPPVTGPLRDLVARRASGNFADRLEARGFVAVDRVERRSLRVGDDDAHLSRYDARCPVDGLTLSVDGWLAAWAPDRTFRLAGGVYPTGVVGAGRGGGPDDGKGDGRGSDGGVAATLREHIDPSAFRAELFDLIRATG